MKMALEKENRFFILSIIVAVVLSSLLSLIPIWQLVILAGIAAGLLNKTMRKGTLSGGAGVLIFWTIYVAHGIITKNSYKLLDQFGALLFSRNGFLKDLFLLLLLLDLYL